MLQILARDDKEILAKLGKCGFIIGQTNVIVDFDGGGWCVARRLYRPNIVVCAVCRTRRDPWVFRAFESGRRL
jgi:hypothetical protein